MAYYRKKRFRRSNANNLSAVGKNFNTIYQQLKTLQASSQVIKAKTSQGSFAQADQDGQSKINFNIELAIDPEIFYK